MFEKFQLRREAINYTQEDLKRAQERLSETEDILNSFDLSDDFVDEAKAMEAKKNWEEARKFYLKIYNTLSPHSDKVTRE